MAANQPRIQITPSREVAPLLAELSKLLKQPQSRLASELLDQAVPALVATVEALRIVRKQPEAAKTLMDNFATKAIRDLTQEQMNFSEALKKKPGRKPAPKVPKKGARGRTP